MKKNNLAPLALRVQNILVYGARDTSVSLVLSSRMMKGQSVKRLENRQFSRIFRDRAEGGAGGALAPHLFCKNKNKLNKK